MSADIGKPFRWSGRAIARVSPWLFGLAALGIPFVLLETVADDDTATWSRIYVGGAVGGLVLELLRGRWRLELPSRRRGVGRSPEQSFAPYGPLTDIGFLGRMTTGAVAAPAFLAIVNALDATEQQAADMGAYLASVAVRPDTLAWAVLLGAVSPVVWGLAESLVKARFAVTSTRLEIMQSNVKGVRELLEADRTRLKRAAEQQAVVAVGQAAQLRAEGVEVEVIPSPAATALVEHESRVSEAIGALAACATIETNGRVEPNGVAEPTGRVDGSVRNGN
jgi:hypothetical protein